MRLSAAVALLLVGSAFSTDVRTINAIVGGTDEMEKVFFRSAEAHKASMAAIMKTLTVDKAVAELEKSHPHQKELAQITSMVLKGKGKLRAGQPKGYEGLEPARKLLNEMIYEAYSKYDAEIMKCTEYYSEQCAAMETCRGQISASNYIAANSRALILDSQTTINKCQVDIPTRKLELKQHNLKCEHEITRMKDRLKIVDGDIAVMTTILEMTDCDADGKSFMQKETFTILKCVDQCTGKTFLEFKEHKLQDAIKKLQSKLSKELLYNNFDDLADGIEGLEASMGLGLVEIAQAPNVTNFTNPPLPVTEVPGNPCKEPPIPSLKTKRAAKCTLGKKNCYKLQERFLLIQSGMQDEADTLVKNIDKMERVCEEIKNTLETQIKNDEDMLSNAQTKLAQATEKEATAAEIARKTAEKHQSLNDDLVDQMKKCNDAYIGFEGEICALKKIRGELYKIKGGDDAGAAFFVDCELSAWEPEECTKVCAGGDQKLSRSVLTHPNGGAGCLPLTAERSCNNQPCPVDCRLAPWSGWSKCSADCGGGVQQRLREVKRAMKYGGKQCGETSQTRACAPAACEKDCELSGWSDWTHCSKDCNGGTKKRTKYVTHEPEGAGVCSDEWSVKRFGIQGVQHDGMHSSRD